MKIKIWIKAMDICQKYWGCHQLPERSFFIKGYQFPVCSRCMGIWIGGILAVVLIAFRLIVPLPIGAIIMLPMIVDGGLQYLFKIMSTNLRRILTGLLFGFGFVQIIVKILFKIF